MTSEIAIMNKEAIALAADSAETYGEGDKIWPCANKIFALSKYQPVGIMVYGSSEFMGVPWETMIKMYRSRLGKKSFPRITDYMDDFFGFLESNEHEFSESEEEEHYTKLVYSYFLLMRDEIVEGIDEIGENTRDDSVESLEDRILNLVPTIIEKHLDNWNASDFIKGCGKRNLNKILREYNHIIHDAIIDVFEELKFEKDHIKSLERIAASLPIKEHMMNHSSGIVIAGFGTSEMFPALQAVEIEGFFLGVFKYQRSIYFQISNELESIVFPFAQSEMASTFMEGVDPSYQEKVEAVISELTDSASVTSEATETERESEEVGNQREEPIAEPLTSKIAELKEFRQQHFVDPIVGVVAVLPKTELAAMAEALVNLTSLRKKVSMAAETVGGPIDVAVISKGDGLIWVQRKHYFEADKNQHFFGKYFKEER